MMSSCNPISANLSASYEIKPWEESVVSTVGIHRDDDGMLANRRNPQCKQILRMFNKRPVNTMVYATSAHMLNRRFVSTLSDGSLRDIIAGQLNYNFA